jgi:hypothetical protein
MAHLPALQDDRLPQALVDAASKALEWLRRPGGFRGACLKLTSPWQPGVAASLASTSAESPSAQALLPSGLLLLWCGLAHRLPVSLLLHLHALMCLPLQTWR